MELQHKLILVWITFSLVFGTLEAVYFSKNQKHVKLWGRNIHDWFTVVRFLVGLPLGLLVVFKVGVLESLLFGVVMMLIFPFFHDGIYYTVRELIKKGTYPLYWMDQSTTTDAKNSYNIVFRVLFLIAALLIFPY